MPTNDIHLDILGGSWIDCQHTYQTARSRLRIQDPDCFSKTRNNSHSCDKRPRPCLIDPGDQSSRPPPSSHTTRSDTASLHPVTWRAGKECRCLASISRRHSRIVNRSATVLDTLNTTSQRRYCTDGVSIRAYRFRTCLTLLASSVSLETARTEYQDNGISLLLLQCLLSSTSIFRDRNRCSKQYYSLYLRTN
jgi:hypothetical protein